MTVRVYDTDSSAQPLFSVTDVESVTLSKDGTWIGTKSMTNPDGKQTLMYEASTHKIVIERSGAEE